MLKIEFLFSEVANLFGDLGNIEYIKLLFPHADFIHTDLSQKPKFLDNDIDLVFIGSMSEKTQENIIHILQPYKKEFLEKIESGTHFLFLGNSLEILGEYIEEDNGNKIPGLGIFPIYAKRQMLDRLSTLFQGKYEKYCTKNEDINIYGAKVQFTQIYYLDQTKELPAFCSVVKGFGLNKESKKEGLQYKNFIATNIIGPLLLLNPYFTKLWAEQIGRDSSLKLPLDDVIYKAYDIKAKQFENLEF